MVTQPSAVIFGGTFDPPQEGHVDAINQLFENGHSLVVIAPTTQNPFKQHPPTPVSHRVQMLRLILNWYKIPILKEPQHCSQCAGVFLSEIEYQRAWEFVAKWNSLFQGYLLSWAVGEDIVQEVPTWERWDELKLDVVALKERLAVHSTEIRNGTIKPHPSLASFIASHRLYDGINLSD
jgi:cytidyltransferase-like protein